MRGQQRWVGVAVCAGAMIALGLGCATSSKSGGLGAVKMAPAEAVAAERVTMKTAELHDLPEGGLAAAAMADGAVVPVETQAWSHASTGEYLIGPGDVLMFRSFDDPLLDTQAQVRFDGYISLPLIPDVRVSQLSRAEATELVRLAYQDVFVDPQISLTVAQTASKTYYVMGDIMRPAEYPYLKPITLLGAINAAGGLRINQRSGDAFVGAQGQLTKAIIFRHVKGERQVLEFDLRNLSNAGPHAADTPVFPGDFVYIPEGVNLVYIIGEVRAPGVFQLAENMTLLEALARSGGPVFSTAMVRNVVIMREIDPERSEVMLVNLRDLIKDGTDVLLKPGDVIYVPRKNIVRLQEFVQRFTGSISPLLSLYTQALQAYYEDDRLKLITESRDDRNNNNILGLFNAIQQIVPNIPVLP